MGFQEQCCKENNIVGNNVYVRMSCSHCDKGHEQSTRRSPRDSSLLRGSLNHDFIAAYFDRNYCILKHRGSELGKDLGTVMIFLPAVHEPRHPAVFTIVPSNPKPLVPTLWVPCHLVFSRNTHRYSEVTLLTDVPLPYCFSQLVNTAGRTLNKQTEAKSFPGRASLYRLCLSLCKRPSIMTLLLTWSKIFCVKKGRHNGISPVQMWFSHPSLLSFIDKWYQKAEAKQASIIRWMIKKNTNCTELLILNFLSPNLWPSHHLTAEVALSPEGRSWKWWEKRVGKWSPNHLLCVLSVFCHQLWAHFYRREVALQTLDIPQLAHICLLEMKFYWTRIMLVRFDSLQLLRPYKNRDGERGSKNDDSVGIT